MLLNVVRQVCDLFLQEFLHSGNMTEAGPLDLIDDNDNENDGDESLSLPGVLKGEVTDTVNLLCIYHF